MLVFLAVTAVLCTPNSVGQQPAVPMLTLTQVEDLVTHHVPDSTMHTEIQRRGLAFAPHAAIAETLRAKGAGPLTLAAVEADSLKGTRDALAPTHSTTGIKSTGIKSRRPALSRDEATSRRVAKILPVYPPLARLARIQGEVILDIVIAKDGSVSTIEVVSGHPMLINAATDAVKKWKYRPFLQNGVSVDVETRVTVNFELEQA